MSDDWGQVNEGYRHSISTADLMITNHAKFIMKVVAGYDKFESSDAMIRGNATEHAVNEKLLDDTIDLAETAKQDYINRGGDGEKEMNFSMACADVMYKELQSRQLNTPTEYQLKLYDEKFMGCTKPIIGFLDWKFGNNDTIVDAKSTARVPSVGKAKDIRQQSLYWGMTGKKYRMALLYASDKKCNFIEIPTQILEEQLDIVVRNFKFIESCIERFTTLAEWINAFPYPNFEDFGWNYDEELKQITIEKWRSLWHKH